jgi:hypothetical protein
MNGFRQAIRRALRGPRACAVLAGLGIHGPHYWLLVDLFEQLSDRGEMLDQLGRNGVALRVAAWTYAAFSALISLLLVAAQPPLPTYFASFLVVTAFLLLILLLSETGNSLINPAEGLVLAHQPVDGATYTAAKLSHLARIVLFLVAGINAVPALAGLVLEESVWWYPLLHLSAALGVGFLAALLCCALYGWLIRLVPVARLKAAAQLVATLPLLAAISFSSIRDSLVRSKILERLPSEPAARWALGIAAAAVAVAVVALGLRSLSADYLVRISGIIHGRPARRAADRKSRTGGLVSRLFGGQPARAGFAYVCRMSRRDFQFRRQVAPMLIVTLLGCAPLIASGWQIDPFSRRFTTAHLLPHLFGILLLFLCSFIAYGSDSKAAWVFLLAPAQAFSGFARGVYAALWIQCIVVPHVIMLLVFAWPWGIWRSAVFVAYSAAIGSLYLGLELRLIDGPPFLKQADALPGAVALPLLMLAALAMAFGVALQHFLVFRSPATVVAAAVVVGMSAFLLTRSSLGALERSIRYRLGLLSAESGTLYREIDM